MRKQLRVCLLLLASLALAPAAVAADTTTLFENAINGTTIAFVRVDSANVQLSPKLLELAQQDATGTLGELTRIVTQPVKQLQELLQNEPAFLAIDLPYSPRVQSRLLASTNLPAAKLKSLAQLVWPHAIGEVSRNSGWRMVSLGMSDGAISIPAISADLAPAPTAAWETALQATATFPVQLIVVYPEYVRDTVAEINCELPAMLGGGSATTLVSGVDWLSLGFDPHSATLRLIAQTKSVESAEAVKSRIPKLLRGLLNQAKLDAVSSAMLTPVLDLLQPTVRDSQVVLSLEDAQQADALMQLGAAAITAAAEPMSVSQTQNNLKQLVLAMFNYESTFKALPTYHKPEQSKGLSWRVHILPFIEHAELYQEFHLDEAWDSPHNIRLLERMPEVFKPVIPIGSKETVRPFHTSYVAPIGARTVFGQDQAVSFQHVTDGTSNTIIYVELKPEHAIPWTSPEEYPFDPANPAAKLRSVNGRISAAFMDGSVRGILVDEPVHVWNALFSRNGGEVVDIK